MKLNVNEVYRQGDVLIVALTDGIPSEAKPIQPDRRGYVLAEGEVTGHAHVLTAAPNVEAYSLAEQLFFAVSAGNPAPVTHQEHGYAYIPVDRECVVIRQVEYTPAALQLVRD